MSEYVSLVEQEQLGMAGKALSQFTREQRLLAIRSESGVADTYMQKVIGIPLGAPYPDAVKVHVARMSIFSLFSTAGFNRDGDDKLLEDNYDRAIRFFEMVAAGKVALGPGVTPPIDDPSNDLEGPYVLSDPGRGYPSDGYV